MPRPELKNLVIAARDAAAKWHDLGVQLDLPDATLTTIALHPDIESHLRMMLSKWLQYDPEASWEKLADALNTIGKNVIAANIRQRFVSVAPTENQETKRRKRQETDSGSLTEPSENQEEEPPKNKETDHPKEKRSNAKNSGSPKPKGGNIVPATCIKVVAAVLVIACAIILPILYNHGAHRSESEHTDPTESGRTRADRPMDPHTKENWKSENIMYGDAEKRKFIKEKKPLSSPKHGSKIHEQLQQYCQEIILIIHTVNDNEKWAALANMKPPKIEDDNGEVLQRPIDLFEANWIVLGEFGGYKAALIQTEMGADSHDELLDALKTFPNAKYVVAVGVAAAASNKAKLCDVLVSKWIDGVSNMKFSKDNHIIFRASGSRFTPTLQRLRNIFARGTDTWVVMDDFSCTKDGRKPNILPGSLISSSVLMDNKNLRDEFVANNPEAVGIEMEGYKLAEIQNRKETRDQRDLGVIVIKGVSDLGDGTKSKEWQFTAAMAAASYARHKLEETDGFLVRDSPT